jgi:UDPglucose--hexose-1-phosphate uridylyltransferase
MTDRPHRRLNLLTGQWVLVSPHRLSRPWLGAEEAPQATELLVHDQECALCPRVLRANGARNPDYVGPFVFENDFPALLDVSEASEDRLLRTEPETGTCRVICYHHDHSLTLSRMTGPQARAIIDAWRSETAELGARPDIGAVTIFENRGAMMGASNPHPHGQIWATASIPSELATEKARCDAYFAAHGEPLLYAYLQRELAAGERIVLANDSFVALVPFWAAWPFETLVLPRSQLSHLSAMRDAEAEDLADILRRLLAGCDRLFDCTFPYSLGVHQAGFDGVDWDSFSAHVHVFPPLLRSASVRKFMVGFEMFAMAQRDLTPEAAAQRLRAAIELNRGDDDA